jgi:hypothetical protein
MTPAPRVRLGALIVAAALLFAGPAATAGGTPTTPSPPVVVRVSDGFHWGDAAIGAAATLGFVLLIAALRRHNDGFPVRPTRRRL